MGDRPVFLLFFQPSVAMPSSILSLSVFGVPPVPLGVFAWGFLEAAQPGIEAPLPGVDFFDRLFVSDSTHDLDFGRSVHRSTGLTQ